MKQYNNDVYVIVIKLCKISGVFGEWGVGGTLSTFEKSVGGSCPL